MIRRGASSMRLLLAMHPYQPDMYRPTLMILALWIKGMNHLDLRETIKSTWHNREECGILRRFESNR